MKLADPIDILGAYVMRPCHWDAEAAAWAKLIPCDNPAAHGRQFEAMVRDGLAEAFEIVGDRGRIGVIIGAVDHSYDPPEFSINGAFSPETGGDLVQEQMPTIEALALELGCATVRFHTMRPGLVEKAKKQGFRMVEVIMRKDIRHG